MAQVYKSRNEIPTIDVNLVVIETQDGQSFGFETANQIEVETQMEEGEATRLIIKGKLKAQKPQKNTLVGNEITLHDNVFNPELVVALQGGKITYKPESNEISKYEPPAPDEDIEVKPFKLITYSAQYNAAGVIVNYEKTTYPNCQGNPVAFSSEDGAFRAPEYTIISAPAAGEAPYSMEWVDELPTLAEPTVEGAGAGA